MDKQTTGRVGEDLAATYLQSEGYSLRHRNWRWKHWELDLVVERNGVLHIIEVKSRRQGGLTPPEAAMTPAKCKAIYQAACRYVELFELDMDTHFDLVAIEFDSQGGHTLRYLPEVFTPRW